MLDSNYLSPRNEHYFRKVIESAIEPVHLKKTLFRAVLAACLLRQKTVFSLWKDKSSTVCTVYAAPAETHT